MAGGTDAGKIHLFRQGVPSVVIDPVRYIHDHTGVAHVDDYNNALRLLVALARIVDKQVLQELQDNL